MAYRAPARQRRLDHVPSTDRLEWHGGIDLPASDLPSVGRTFTCSGWAWPFESERVRRVELLVGDAEPVAAHLTLRPDIAATLDRPEAVLSGFEADIIAPPEATSGDRICVAARVHGMDGGVWTTAELTVAVDTASAPPDGRRSKPLPDREEPAATRWDRALERLRNGYDPWHVVGFVEPLDASRIGGPALAALDALAEREPNLELLIAGVSPGSPLADLLRRSIAMLGLEDRVTVPPTKPDLAYWRCLADFRLDLSIGTDLAQWLAALRDSGRR